MSDIRVGDCTMKARTVTKSSPCTASPPSAAASSSSCSVPTGVSSSTTPRKLSLRELITRSKDIVVCCGAGISVSAGIPDFRSKSTGIYSIIEDEAGYEALPQPECLFSAEFFEDDSKPFWRFAPHLYSSNKGPTPTHRAFYQLHKEKRLKRVYTQNIDNLEIAAGLPEELVIKCHGSLDSLTCQDCGRKFIDAPSVIQSFLDAQKVPHCGETGILQGDVYKEDNAHIARERKRPRRSCVAPPTTPLRGCRGVLKPDIVFFGEKVNHGTIQKLFVDLQSADLVIVCGTSLSVRPMSAVLDYFGKLSISARCGTCPPYFVLVNKEKINLSKKVRDESSTPSRSFDFQFIGDCDGFFEEAVLRKSSST